MTTLAVRPRDTSGPDDWPWVLVDLTAPAGADPIWGDYATRAEAEVALHGATHCGRCDTELDRPVGACPNVWCERGPAAREAL